MLEPPIATSTPRTKQWGKRKSKNNRRSISLVDVSVIQTPDVSNQKCESNETLTSVCKDSGYVHSEGSWLEDDETKESKDLAEELKFKDVLISELQESNRGLRIRCADAENKIWRLRIKCEEHCGCCQVKGTDSQDDQDDIFSDSSDQIVFPSCRTPSYKRHSLAVSKFEDGDEGHGIFRGRAPSNTVSNHRSGESLKNKPLVRSLSSGMIPIQKRRVITHVGRTNEPRLTTKNLSLSKVQWWQRDLFTRDRESPERDQTALEKFKLARKKTYDESDNESQPEEPSVSNDAKLVSRLVVHHNDEEFKRNVGHNTCCDENFDTYYPCSSDENGNRTNDCKDVCLDPSCGSVLSRSPPVQSSSESDSSFVPSLPTQTTKKHVRLRNGAPMHQNGVKLAFLPGSSPQDYRPLNQNNLGMSSYPDDGMIIKPRCEIECCFDSHKAGMDDGKVSSSSPNNVNQTQSNCNCAHPSPQIFIVPSACCCRLLDSSSRCKQTCCPCDGNSKCDQPYHDSSKAIQYPCSDAPSNRVDHLPLFVPKSKSASVPSKESSPVPFLSDRKSVISEQNPAQAIIPCNDNNCHCATPCSGGLTVPFVQTVDTKAKMERDIEERMNKLASHGRAETDILSFKPWPPSHFAEMRPLVRLLVETSAYARQLGMELEKVNGRVQRISAMDESRPSV